jgi:hypothetical protein
MHQRFLTSSLLLVYAIWISAPILFAGYYSDDVPNGLVLGAAQLTQQSILAICKTHFLLWFYNGRIFPVAIFTGYPFFYFFHTITSYQVAHSILIWISLLSVAWMVKQITKQMMSALLLLFLIPLCWSVRDYHDPLTSFSTLLPLVTLFSAITIGGFIKAVEEKKWYWSVGSLLAYVLAICTYEIGMASFVVIFLLGMTNQSSFKKQIKNIVPYFIITFLYVALTFYLRAMKTAHVYDGVQLGDLSHFGRTFVYQLTAALPLSYHLFSENRLLLSSLFDSNFSLTLQCFLMLGLLTISMWLSNTLLTHSTINKRSFISLITVGLVFILVPSFFVGISKKYQAEVSIGLGYLPVYMEYVGFAIVLLALLLCNAGWKQNKWILYAISGVLSFIISISFILNYRTVRSINDNWQNPRVLVEAALHHGLLADLPLNSTLYKYHGVWATSDFFMQNAAVRVDTLDFSKNVLSSLQIKRALTHGYFMDYYTLPDSTSGYVVFGKLKSVHYQEAKIVNVVITNPKVFLFSGKRKYMMFSGNEVTLDEIIRVLTKRIPMVGVNHFSKLKKNETLLALPKGQYQINKLPHQYGLEQAWM